MHYQPPSLTAIRLLAKELRESYLKFNSKRLYFITLLEHITINVSSLHPNKIFKILMGVAIFELEAIYNEYVYYNKYLGWSPEHSKMVQLIQGKLKVSKDNPLTNDVRIYYLNKFYQYVKKNISDEDILQLNKLDKNPVWKNKEGLVAHIHHLLTNLVNRDAKRIDQLIYATPELIALRKGTKNLPAQYKAARQNRWTSFQNAEREPLLKLITMIDHSFYHFYPAFESERIKRLQECESKARRGLILFALLDIDSTYHYKWLNSPKGNFIFNGSDLYKESLNILNLNSLDQLSHEERVNLLSALLDHIHDIQNDREYYQAKKIKWKSEGYSDLDMELYNLRIKIDKLKKKEGEQNLKPSTTAFVVSKGTNYATQYGLTYLAKRTAVTTLVPLIATGISGPLAGVAIYAGSALLMTGLGQLITEGVLTSATAQIYAWILERIGGSVATKAADYVTYKFFATKEGLHELRGKLSREDEKAFRKWVNTLLELPEDIFSETKKQQIRNVLGLDKGSKLHALQDKMTVNESKNTTENALLAMDSIVIEEDYVRLKF